MRTTAQQVETSRRVSSEAHTWSRVKHWCTRVQRHLCFLSALNRWAKLFIQTIRLILLEVRALPSWWLELDQWMQELPLSFRASLVQRKWKLFLNLLWCWVKKEPKPNFFELFPLVSLWLLRHCWTNVCISLYSELLSPSLLLSSAFSLAKGRDYASFFCVGFCWTKAIDAESRTLTSNPWTVQSVAPGFRCEASTEFNWSCATAPKLSRCTPWNIHVAFLFTFS